MASQSVAVVVAVAASSVRVVALVVEVVMTSVAVAVSAVVVETVARAPLARLLAELRQLRDLAPEATVVVLAVVTQDSAAADAPLVRRPAIVKNVLIKEIQWIIAYS